MSIPAENRITAPGPRRPVNFARLVPVPVAVAVAVIGREPQRVIGAPHDMRVGYGRCLDDDGVTVVPVWCEAAEHPELFPTFDGGLELRPASEGTELRLVGSYRPPSDALGRFADSLVGHRIVVASLERLLSIVATRLVLAARFEETSTG